MDKTNLATNFSCRVVTRKTADTCPCKKGGASRKGGERGSTGGGGQKKFVGVGGRGDTSKRDPRLGNAVGRGGMRNGQESNRNGNNYGREAQIAADPQKI